MENKDANMGQGQDGACGPCNKMSACADKYGCCGHRHKHAGKWLIKIIVIILIFCFGFQMGELKGMLRGSYSHRSYDRFQGGMMYPGYGSGWGTAQPMMYGFDANQNTAPSTSVNPTK